MQLAEQLGIPHPRTLLPRSSSEAASLAKRLGQRLVIKPRSSCGGRGIAYVEPEDDIGARWAEVHAQHEFPMLQACIPPGQKYDVGVLMDRNSRPVATFVQKELRHFPLRDGLSTMQESVYRPDLVERAVALLQAIGWYGLAEVEFMEHALTGEALLLELNPRFWASIQLAVTSGVDFPHLLYQLAVGEPVRETHEYEIGRKCRWLLPGDLLHFLSNRDRRRMVPSFWEFGGAPTSYDGIYRDDPGATLGTLLSCGHYLFDRDLWGLLTRRAPAPQPVPVRVAAPTALPALARRAA